MGIVMMILGIVLAIGIMLFVNKKKNIKKDFATFFIAAALVALVLEFFTFNYTTYENIGQSLKKSESTITFDELKADSTNKNYSAKKESLGESSIYTIEIKHINSKVNDVYVEPPIEMERAKVEIDYKDDVLTNYSTLPDKEIYVSSKADNSKYIRLHLAGKVSELKLRIESKGVYSTKSQFTIAVNKNIPLRFKMIRALIVLGVLLALALIYQNRNLNYAGKKSKKVRRIAIASLLTVQILFIVLLANGHNKIDNPFVFENTQEKPVSALDQYQKLAMAFSKGQTYLDGLDSENLKNEKGELENIKNLKDPFKPNLRDEELQKKGTSFAWDHAYNDGHYYTYYGPVPVVFTFLPVYAIAGKMLTTRFVTTLFAIIISILMCLLVHNIAKRRKLNMWTVIGVMGASLSTIFLTSVFGGAKIYELSPLGGLICVFAGINLIYEGVHRKSRNKLFLCLGALAMALAVGCKASFLLASIVVLPLILNYLASKGSSAKENRLIKYFANVFCKENITTIIAIVVPYVIIGILLMIYNSVRFGSPLDFGVAHQLTVYDTSYFKLTSISKLPTVIQNGLLKLPHTSADFPFLNIPDAEITYHGYIFAMAGVGVFAYPFIWAFVGVPVAIKNSLKNSRDRAFVAVTAIMALVLCYTTIVMGGSSFRYSLDFGWAFTIPSIFVIFAIEEWARKKKVLRQALLGIYVVVFATILINVLLSFSSGFVDMGEARPTLYYDIYNTIMFWR